MVEVEANMLAVVNTILYFLSLSHQEFGKTSIASKASAIAGENNKNLLFVNLLMLLLLLIGKKRLQQEIAGGRVRQ